MHFFANMRSSSEGAMGALAQDTVNCSGPPADLTPKKRAELLQLHSTTKAGKRHVSAQHL